MQKIYQTKTHAIIYNLMSKLQRATNLTAELPVVLPTLEADQQQLNV
jgi:hypothetical protein